MSADRLPVEQLQSRYDALAAIRACEHLLVIARELLEIRADAEAADYLRGVAERCTIAAAGLEGECMDLVPRH